MIETRRLKDVVIFFPNSSVISVGAELYDIFDCIAYLFTGLRPFFSLFADSDSDFSYTECKKNCFALKFNRDIIFENQQKTEDLLQISVVHQP